MSTAPIGTSILTGPDEAYGCNTVAFRYCMTRSAQSATDSNFGVMNAHKV